MPACRCSRTAGTSAVTSSWWAPARRRTSCSRSVARQTHAIISISAPAAARAAMDAMMMMMMMMMMPGIVPALSVSRPHHHHHHPGAVPTYEYHPTRGRWPCVRACVQVPEGVRSSISPDGQQAWDVTDAIPASICWVSRSCARFIGSPCLRCGVHGASMYRWPGSRRRSCSYARRFHPWLSMGHFG
eukprot:COSAG01_NODE_1412_length_10404_cov_48.915478_2_plen_187_part_00